MDSLPDELVSDIFKYVGLDSYIFIAGTNHQFRQVYATLIRNENKEGSNGLHCQRQGGCTSGRSIAESVSRAKLFVEMDRKKGEEEGKECPMLRVQRVAALHGNLEILTWARAQECQHDHTVFESAVKGGQVRVLDWLYQTNCQWDDNVGGIAAEKGHLDVLKWLKAHDGMQRQYSRPDEAESSRSNDVTLANELKRNRPSGEQLVAKRSKINNRCVLDEGTCRIAAKNGHLAVLQWLRANDCPWDEDTTAHAALNNHLTVLQWARSNGCPWDEDTCAYAAEHGHLTTLQWARSNGCPWDSWTCAFAAEHGHLRVLQWARSNGCPWDEYTYANAAHNGHLDVARWAKANGCPR